MSDTTKLSVFLSYSRANLAVATQLIYSLEAFGFNVTVDHEEIAGGEAWRARLRQLILEADAVIFALSPEAAVSKACKWEVETALTLSKRIVPAVVSPLGDVQPHPALRDLNYVFFYPEPAVPSSGFGKGLATLISALSQDLEWVRGHTQLIELAERWKEDRPRDLLLRGTELAAALQWRLSRPANAPALTEAQIAYLSASEDMERSEENKRKQQLDEMEKALTGREEAQSARARATSKLIRRTYFGIALAVALTSVAVFQWRTAEVALERTAFEQGLQDRMLDFIDANRGPPDGTDMAVDVLARRYEGKEPDHVSSELDVGHFYGIYRIRAGADQTNMQEFLAFARKSKRRNIAKVLNDAGGVMAANEGAPEFVAAWKMLATDPATKDRFETLQRAFVRNVDFARMERRLDNPPDATNPGIGLKVTQRTAALQAVMVSIVVQYGPSLGVNLVREATRDVANPKTLSDRALIDLLYVERDKVERYFPDIQEISPRYIELIRLRNRWEKQDALHLLNLQKGQPAGK